MLLTYRITTSSGTICVDGMLRSRLFQQFKLLVPAKQRHRPLWHDIHSLESFRVIVHSGCSTEFKRRSRSLTRRPISSVNVNSWRRTWSNFTAAQQREKYCIGLLFVLSHSHTGLSLSPPISPTQLTESMRVEYGRTIRNQFGQVASIDRARGRINGNIFGHNACTVALDEKHEPNYRIIIGCPEIHAWWSAVGLTTSTKPKKCNKIACAYCELSAENRHQHVLSPTKIVVLLRHCLEHCVADGQIVQLIRYFYHLFQFVAIMMCARFFHISLDLFSA